MIFTKLKRSLLNPFRFFFTLLIITLAFPLYASATSSPQMSIVPTSTAPITINATSGTTVTYTVTAHAPEQAIQVSASSVENALPSYVTASLAADGCSGTTLAVSGTCTFSLSLIASSGHVGDTFILAPRVSGNSDGSYSVPIGSNRIAVTVGSAPSTPTITSVSPTSGTTAGGTSVVITGTNFTGATAVTFGGGNASSYTVDSATQITATTQSHAAGAVDVAVTTAGGTATSSGAYTYVAPPSIAVTEPSLMFINRNFGNTSGSNYNGTLTVQNTGSSTVTNIIATPSSGSNITYVSALPSGCTTSLAASSSCVLTFSSAIPLTSPSTSTISVTADGISTPLSISVASISVVALAPPLNNLPSSSTDNYRNFEGLTLVAACDNTLATTGDAGLLEITNNSSTTLSAGITAAITGLTGVTITNPAKTSTNNYCNGATLTTGQYCEVRVNVNSAVAGATGTITLSGTGTNPVGVATSVVAQASSFPYSTGNSTGTNYIFVANNSCNLVEEVAAQSDTQNNINWTNANTYCSGTINTHSDWRFPDVGPVPGSTGGGSSISGEFATLYASGTPLAGMSTSNLYWGPNIDASNAWFEDFVNGGQANFSKPNTFNLLYVRCARAFTT